MAGGYCGKVLRIHLTTGTITEEHYSDDMLRKYIGGSGLACKIVCEETDEKTDPLAPKNVLAFMTGPFVGTQLPNFGRYQAAAKSPLTNSLGEGNSGGSWGTNLKYAGYDGIILNGVSPKPVYIHIEDGKVQLLDASEIWGLDTFETSDWIKAKHGSKTVPLSIGQAGENLVKFASIMNDGYEARAVGRCGLGAVMGSKKVKAISVKGNVKVPVLSENEIKESVRQWGKTIHDNLNDSLGKYGTSCGVEFVERIGDLPIKNWTEGNFDIKNLTGQWMAETILVKRYFCAQCVVGCGRTVEIKEGPYSCVTQGGPEYESIGMLGPNCMIGDIQAVQKANELCNRYGLDTITAGAVVAFAMEAYENNIITKEMAGGCEIKWGCPENMFELLEKIAFRKDIGDILAEGSKGAAKKLKGISEEFLVDVKGLELPAHDARAGDATALQYATSTRGACHLNSLTSDLTLAEATCGFGFMPAKNYNRFNAGDDEIELVAIHQHVMAMFDSMTGCKFLMFGLGKDLMDQLLYWFKLVTGWDITLEEFLKTGERIFNMKRMYQVKCGITRKDDLLPPRLSKRRMTGGTANNIPDVFGMIDKYYEYRKWDTYGRPTKELISELDLEWLA